LENDFDEPFVFNEVKNLGDEVSVYSQAKHENLEKSLIFCYFERSEKFNEIL
jgi:hypothetical protein